MTGLQGLHGNEQCMFDYYMLILLAGAFMDVQRVTALPEDHEIGEQLVLNVLSSVDRFSILPHEISLRVLSE